MRPPFPAFLRIAFCRRTCHAGGSEKRKERDMKKRKPTYRRPDAQRRPRPIPYYKGRPVRPEELEEP